MKAFVSWSGGKDCMLACWRVMKNPEIHVTHLVNMLSEEGLRSCSHGLSAGLLAIQSEHMGIKILQRKSDRKHYEAEFKKGIQELKTAGVEAGVFGDIDLVPHREWIERVCFKMGIQAIFPLWEEARETLMTEFIRAGFRSKLVAVDETMLGREWLGKDINECFLRKLRSCPGVDLCGEKGEYHSFVYDGPLFKTPVSFYMRKVFTEGRYAFLELYPGSESDKIVQNMSISA